MTTVITGHEGRTVHDRRATAADLGAVFAMLGRCSRETLYRRFHGVTDGTAYARQLLTTPTGHDTLCAWRGDACVAIATLAGGQGGWDVGVLVEDEWQRHGVGTSLLHQLVGIARGRGIEALDADVLAESTHVLRSLARIGTVDARLSWGVYHVRVTLTEGSASGAIAGAPVGPGPCPADARASRRGTDPPMGNRYAVGRVREGTRP